MIRMSATCAASRKGLSCTCPARMLTVTDDTRALPSLRVGREQLIELLAANALRRYESQYEASHLTWRDFATEAAEDVDALVSAGWVLTEPLPEWSCPGCGATTRARMADHGGAGVDATP